jgi:hypothetical protein
VKKRICVCVCIVALAGAGCSRIAGLLPKGKEAAQTNIATGDVVAETTDAAQTEPPETEAPKPAKPEAVKVKGIYISAFVAGTRSRIDEIVEEIDHSQINALVIDVKNDDGRVTFPMDSPLVTQLGSVKTTISDIDGLMEKLKGHDIYTIARIVAFRDPYLPEQRPEWGLQLADGSLYRDKKGSAWINPYKKEVWDYLVEICRKAGEAGFDEVQFDYIRFCTERGIDEVVYDEADVKGRSQTQVITEFIDYAYAQLKDEIYVSADVFGTIITSDVDAGLVGQDYSDMASALDYICPMVYPSHYSNGSFGISRPDLEPYQTIFAAMQASWKDLEDAKAQAAAASGGAAAGGSGSGSGSAAGESAGQSTAAGDGSAGATADGDGSGSDGTGGGGVPRSPRAIVRPWLQDFTASYLGSGNYREYGPDEINAEIQAVYDAGYDEWLLWDASCNYSWEGLRE